MKLLFICGSSVPTLCGVGKYTDKIANLLVKNNHEVVLIGNKNQKLGKKDGAEVSYNLIKIDILFKNLFKIFQIIKNERPDVINIQYNSLEFGRSAFPSILSVLLKIRFPKIHLQVNIHEFSSYTLLGKIRHIIPTIFADKVFFSDRKQLESALLFSRNFIKNKSCIMSLGSVVKYILPDYKPFFSDGKELHIAFHGLIQLKNGIEYLLKSLVSLNKQNIRFKLHILGAFQLLADYGNLNIEIDNYQKDWLEFIKINLADDVIIYGDVPPDSDLFREVLQKTEICVVPDNEGMTIRRSSFWNVFMQSQNIMFASFDEYSSDLIFKEFITFKPKNDKSLAQEIVLYSKLTSKEKMSIWEKQEKVKAIMDIKIIEPEVIKMLTLSKYNIDK